MCLVEGHLQICIAATDVDAEDELGAGVRLPMSGWNDVFREMDAATPDTFGSCHHFVRVHVPQVTVPGGPAPRLRWCCRCNLTMEEKDEVPVQQPYQVT